MAEDFRFQIRSGSKTPSAKNLLTNELGFDTANSLLYINNKGTIQAIGGAVVPKAKADKNGDQIDTTYLKLTGGTVTGNIYINSAETGRWNQIFLVNNEENSFSLFISDSNYSSSDFQNVGGLRYRFKEESGEYGNNYLIRYTPTDGVNGSMILGEAAISSTISGPFILTARSYGTSLPTTGLTDGRIFFLKES